MTAIQGVEDVIARTARRFARVGERKSTYYYVMTKLRRDPCTQAIAELAPLGDVLDLGCGPGHLATFLLESGVANTVRAVDWDESKIAIARRAAEGLNASFQAADVRHAPLPRADTVLVVDVLHYLDAGAQDALLER